MNCEVEYYHLKGIFEADTQTNRKDTGHDGTNILRGNVTGYRTTVQFLRAD